MIKLPFNPSVSADQVFSALIPEQLVMSIHLVWNDRAGSWFLGVSSSDKKIEGLRVVQRWPLLREHAALSPIEGDLIVLPLTHPAPKVIGYDDLGSTWGLFWMSPDDVKRWEAANGLG